MGKLRQTALILGEGSTEFFQVFTYNYLGSYFSFLKVYIMFRVCSHLKEIHFFILQQMSPHRHPRSRKVGVLKSFVLKRFCFVKTWLFQFFFVPLQHEKEVFNFFTIVKGLKPQNYTKQPPTKSKPSLYQVYTNSMVSHG